MDWDKNEDDDGDENADQHKALQKSCLTTWKSMCFKLWQQSIIGVNADKPMNILFHCFGGINRSAGVLCLAPRSLWLQRRRCDQDFDDKATFSSPLPSRLCFGGPVDGGTTAP